ncbi:uncharacterized protein CDAR_523031 [Caerostris darwini]|uniref:Uncharacterized protein n=1 Tax=Caerostris darwini TaxID=1538125 RepID=A0AAV4TCB8_9ARAC|nr:uncharacterized protein CDAR_523031 [Caerostris darwini]
MSNNNLQMTPLSLEEICLQKVAFLLRSGYWRKYHVNPFTFLPSTVLDELTSKLLSDKANPIQCCLESAPLQPLLTSSRLQHLDLSYFPYVEHFCMFLNLLSVGCQNLQSLSLPENFSINDSEQLELLLLSCHKLEYLHSPTFFNLDALKNCANLKCLRFHFPARFLVDYFCHEGVGSLQYLQSLKVFALCGYYDFSCDYKAIAVILKCCPKIISVGYIDSIMAIQCIQNLQHQRNMPPIQFQLRKCFWGFDSYSRVCYFLAKVGFITPDFPYLIKMAVTFCPYIEELVFTIPRNDSIKYLSGLKNLTFLYIDFGVCDDNYLSEFVSLLCEIGPQLKHLGVVRSNIIPINIAIENCPNLTSLKYFPEEKINQEILSSVSTSCLKNLTLDNCDKFSLLYALSCCKNLKELFIFDGRCLDDNLLNTILDKNPLSELKVVYILKCRLSRKGLRNFLISAKQLDTFFIFSDELELCNKDALLQELNRVNTCKSGRKLLKTEIFNRKLNPCCF